MTVIAVLENKDVARTLRLMAFDVLDGAVQASRGGLDRRGFLGMATSVCLSVGGIASAQSAAVGANASALRAQRLAWAGVRLLLPSTALYIDPLVSAGVWGSALRDSLHLPLDGPDARHVLLTHLHPDHFDPVAVQQIVGSTGMVVCDDRMAPIVASRGFRIRPVRLFEPILIDDLTVTSVPAVDGYGDLQVSWVIAANGQRVIHCGDTLWHGHWWHIGRQLGPFDVAFLPVNGARFAWRQPAAQVASVMSVEQAVAAAVVLSAKRLVPIHYGVNGAKGYEEEPKVESRLIDVAKSRILAVQILRPGDWVQLAKS
jgi:L-ascorbate metabolism protein UlaG (beta-lactamase superfamily)